MNKSDAPVVELERWAGPWSADDSDANLKADVAAHARAERLECPGGFHGGRGEQARFAELRAHRVDGATRPRRSSRRRRRRSTRPASPSRTQARGLSSARDRLALSAARLTAGRPQAAVAQTRASRKGTRSVLFHRETLPRLPKSAPGVEMTVIIVIRPQ